DTMEWTPIFQSQASPYTQGDNWQLLFDDTIVEDQTAGWEQYIRRTVASFRCSLCKRTWPSNRVTVLFHFYLDNNTHQGTVKVRRYRQNCKRCTNAPMEQPRVRDENVAILMENLVKNIRKKCYHETFDEVPREYMGVEVDSPHEPAHCEAEINVSQCNVSKKHGTQHVCFLL
uniref:3CxxC-type domain-containing protein n=1 Tax=Periophthalmus magnuspinnatus TaxID=409849 RepID=A0A3B3ZL93_9GOBI